MKKTLRDTISKKTILIIMVTLFMFLKGIIFTFIGASTDGVSFGGVVIDFQLIFAHIAILGLLVFPAFLFKKKGVFRYLIVIDLLYSVLLIADLWYYRASGYYLGLKYIFFKDIFNPLGRSLINPNKLDLLFILDIPIIILVFTKLKERILEKREYIKALVSIMVSIVIILGTHYLFDVKRVSEGSVRFVQDDWEASWCPSTRVANRSPLGDHFYEAYQTIKKVCKKENTEDINEIEEWLEWNKEDLPDNQFKGMAEGKNVIFLQIESLEDFVINQSVFGQEITPNLNKLVTEGLYFNNVHEQNNGANSIDADVLANAGMLTLGDSVTFLTHPEVKYNSLARLLKEKGYKTVASHVEKPGDWGWAEGQKGALGVDVEWDISQYNLDEYVGFGLSDRSLYTQFLDKVSNLSEPFYAMVPTLSSHGPFDIADEYRELDLPEEIDSNRFGGYLQSIHYADKQIGLFMDLLEEKGLADNTIVVIYGDHSGVHKYYMEDIEATNMDGDWWQEYEKNVPFIICGKGIENKVVDTYGGHIDIMPTVAYLLGLDTEGLTMGRNLLNTNRNATVLKGAEVIGEPTDKEREMLEKAFYVADLIIKNDYFNKKGLIK